MSTQPKHLTPEAQELLYTTWELLWIIKGASCLFRRKAEALHKAGLVKIKTPAVVGQRPYNGNFVQVAPTPLLLRHRDYVEAIHALRNV